MERRRGVNRGSVFGLCFSLSLFLFAFGCGGLIGSCTVFDNANGDANWVRKQAISHGCASFEVVDTLTGETEFKWRGKP